MAHVSMGHLPDCDAMWKVFAYLLFGIGRSPAAMENLLSQSSIPKSASRQRPVKKLPVNIVAQHG